MEYEKIILNGVEKKLITKINEEEIDYAISDDEDDDTIELTEVVNKINGDNNGK